MYADAKAQRPMEVEVILAAPLRYAKKLGLKTPVSLSQLLMQLSLILISV